MEGGTQAVARPPGSRVSERWARARSSPYLLLLPAPVALTAVAAYPLIYGIRSSFERYRFGRDLGSAARTTYRSILHDHVFWTAVGTTASSCRFAVVIETLLGRGMALLVSRELS